MPRIDYAAIYLPQKARAREPRATRGPQLTKKSATALERRSLWLVVLFGSVLAWGLLGGARDAADGSPEGAPGEEERQLQATCIGGLTPEQAADRERITLLCVERTQLTTIGCPVIGDAICLKNEYKGYLVFYFLGVLYMFVGLAIVCDEFFVPALECFVDEFGISMDVAGATFMAAGGSMPELFTSFIATFQKSDVGFAAIVGSAVFNVLFVIAVCAIASTEVLVLTWWPLARDCFFYIVALLTVVLVFSISSPNQIEWWEAVLLLLEYIFYCTFMKFNGKIFDYVKAKFGTTKVEPLSKVPTRSVTSSFTNPSAFRKGIVQLLTQNAYVYETAGIAAVTQIQGNLEDTFRKLDKDGDGILSVDEVKSLLATMGLKPDSAAVSTALRRITRTGENSISFDAFKAWYVASEARVEVEVRRVFDKFDKDGNGTIEREEIASLLKSLGHAPNDEEVSEVISELVSSGLTDVEVLEADTDEVDQKLPRSSVHVTFDQFNRWYERSLFWEKQHRQHLNEEDAADGGLSLECPENPSCKTLFWYLLTYPLCAVMFCTLPDVRQPKWQRNAKVAILEFFLSLVWIGFFSNCIYEWIVICSNTLGLPPPVAGVTILAAGTSIPDLLSSYIVARHGEGDMAVSSSIGSNIFDVTVGLPLPWLIFNIVEGTPVIVKSKTPGFSILVLVAMLACVIGTVVIMRWRMTKALGYVMLVLYVLFVALDLLQQLPQDNPILKINF